MLLPPRSFARRQRGAAAAEFALAAVPLLLAGAAIAEAAHWMLARQLLRLALHEAARAGAVHHAHPGPIRDAFERALEPLYVPAGPHGSPRARMQARHALIRRDAGLEPWRMDILGPPPAAYRDFGRTSAAHGGRAAIPNDYLAEQHARNRARWPDGRGPASGLDIHQANVLHLRAGYLLRPLTPVLPALLRTAAPLASAAARPAFAQGLLFLAVESRMTMQSDPVAWRLPASGITENPSAAAPRPPAPPPGGETGGAPLPLPERPAPGGPDAPAPGGPDAGAQPGLPGPDDGGNLCGVVLCCA